MGRGLPGRKPGRLSVAPLAELDRPAYFDGRPTTARWLNASELMLVERSADPGPRCGRTAARPQTSAARGSRSRRCRSRTSPTTPATGARARCARLGPAEPALRRGVRRWRRPRHTVRTARTRLPALRARTHRRSGGHPARRAAPGHPIAVFQGEKPRRHVYSVRFRLPTSCGATNRTPSPFMRTIELFESYLEKTRMSTLGEHPTRIPAGVAHRSPGAAAHRARPGRPET